MNIIVAVVLGFVSLVLLGLILNDDAAMRKCQEKHSYATCWQELHK